MGDRDRFGSVYFVTAEAVRKNKFRFGLQLNNSSLNFDPEFLAGRGTNARQPRERVGNELKSSARVENGPEMNLETREYKNNMLSIIM